MSHRHFFVNICARKYAFESRAQALQAAKKQADRMRAYRCRFCQKFHLGHSRPSLRS